MKGMRGDRLAPGNCNPRISRGMRSFTPMIDKQAKWHRKFDDMMTDKKHRKKMSKVTLPLIELKEVNWDER